MYGFRALDVQALHHLEDLSPLCRVVRRKKPSGVEADAKGDFTFDPEEPLNSAPDQGKLSTRKRVPAIRGEAVHSILEAPVGLHQALGGRKALLEEIQASVIKLSAGTEDVPWHVIVRYVYLAFGGDLRCVSGGIEEGEQLYVKQCANEQRIPRGVPTSSCNFSGTGAGDLDLAAD